MKPRKEKKHKKMDWWKGKRDKTATSDSLMQLTAMLEILIFTWQKVTPNDHEIIFYLKKYAINMFLINMHFYPYIDKVNIKLNI